MRTSILVTCLWLCLLSAVGAQDTVSPPDQARLVGSPAEITFRWPGSAPSYFLEVFYLNGAAVYQGEVKGTSKTLAVQTGPGYRWRVSLYKGGAYTPVVPLRGFQVLAPESFHFDGSAGASGRSGGFGESGGPGGPGGRGAEVTVGLQPMGDLIQVTLPGRSFLLLPSSDPIEVSAPGGQGGAGGAGGQGVAGDYYLQYPNSTDSRRRYVVTPPGPGGDGGPGGPGGPGGVVTIKAPAALHGYVTADVRGGPGGRGGNAGAPGVTPVTPGGYGYPVPAAPPGRSGQAGSPGPDGRVVSLP